MLFTGLWLTFVYLPIAHMVWFSEGYLFGLGALDFAGGTVVHINSGVAGLVGALMIGKRIGYGRDLLAPHSLTLTFVGACLLWVGWFGFNAGSNLEATGGAALALINTILAPAAAGLAWMTVEALGKGKASLLGIASGAVAGLVAITPAAGLAGPMGSIVLGLVAGAVCYLAVTGVKNALGYDDALDVFGIHGVGGIIGAIGTGIVAAPSLGGYGVGEYSIGGQLVTQVIAVVVTLVWTGIGSVVLYKITDLIVGLRVTAGPGARRPRPRRSRRARLQLLSRTSLPEARTGKPRTESPGLFFCRSRRHPGRAQRDPGSCDKSSAGVPSLLVGEG